MNEDFLVSDDMALDAPDVEEEEVRKFLRMRQAEPQTLQETLADLPMIGETALDVTPVVGDIKGAVELPDDLAMAKQMIEQGYDEGDIMSMGLGGALGALSVAGLIPAAGTFADVAQAPVKAAVKSRLADQTEQMLDKGLATRGRKTVDVEEAEFTGEPRERPTPKVFHGAQSMTKPRSGEAAKFESTLYKFRSQYIADPVYDLFADKESKLISSNLKSVDDIVDEQGYGRFGIPVGEPDGTINVADITFRKGEDGTLDVHFIDLDKNVIEEDAVAQIPVSESGEIEYDKLVAELNNLSKTISSNAQTVGETRVDALKREGFSPFDSFRGEAGLAGPSASGEHSELTKKLLSTSRDPLVSMKPSFGGTDVRNVVYADLPREATADLPPDAYMDAASRTKSLPDLEETQIGYRLPKSPHLEAEEAIANPELLDVKALSDNPELAARVQRGQDTVDRIMSTASDKPARLYRELAENASEDGVQVITPKFAREGYDVVKNVLSDLQSLGQFTEQYGARGTYDDLLEGLTKDRNTYEDFLDLLNDLPKALPQGSLRKRNMQTVSAAMKTLGGKSYSELDADFKSKEVLRDVTDKELKHALYSTKELPISLTKKLDKAGLGVYMDGFTDMNNLGYKDLKRILMLATDNMNRGGLASRK